MLHAFAELTCITLSFHTDKECDTSVVLLVYGPCMVVVVSGMVTSSPSAMILWALHAKVHDPLREGASACSQAQGLITVAKVICTRQGQLKEESHDNFYLLHFVRLHK